MTDIILLIHSGDKNSWIWPYWWRYLVAHWDWDCGIDIVFLGQTKTPECRDLQCYTTGNVPWSQGLKTWLRKHCKASYILYTMEDFLLIRPANCMEYYRITNLMRQHNIGMVRLHNNRYSAPSFQRNERKHGLIKLDNSMPFLCSALCNIWRRDLLESLLVPEEDGWTFERRGTRRLRKMNLELYMHLQPEIYPYRECIRQGKLKATSQRSIDAVDKGLI